MKAWSINDTPTLERLTVKGEGGKSEASQAALTGLDGSVVYVKVNELAVEAKPALTDQSTSEERANFNTREARINVSWLEPESGLVYTQTYALIVQYVNNDWYVKDIQNIATSEGNYKDKL